MGDETSDLQRQPLGIDGSWHLDKKVPIAMIAFLFAQSVTFVWLGATIKANYDFRLEALEKINAERKPQEERFIRLEERVIGIASMIEKIDRRLQEREKEDQP